MFSSFGLSVRRTESEPVEYYDFIADDLEQLRIDVLPVIQINVFGSMARAGRGNDLDLIFVVSEDYWVRFRDEVLHQISDGMSGPRARNFAAGKLLGRWYESFELFSVVPVDVFLFPLDWENRLEELQSALPHEDPEFMKNIAGDVKTLEKMRSEYV